MPIDTPDKVENPVNWSLFLFAQSVFQKVLIISSFKLKLFPTQELGEQLLNLYIEYLSSLVQSCDFDPSAKLCTKYSKCSSENR